jgi:hypothetical protein
MIDGLKMHSNLSTIICLCFNLNFVFRERKGTVRQIKTANLLLQQLRKKKILKERRM